MADTGLFVGVRGHLFTPDGPDLFGSALLAWRRS
jgi:hypothetical protein